MDKNMNRLRVLHNGDLRQDTLKPSPHWVAYVTEDGYVFGEVLTRTTRRSLPKAFRVSDPARFFDIPPDLRRHHFQTSTHPEDIILALVDPTGNYLCTFLLSQLPPDSPLKAAVCAVLATLQTRNGSRSDS